MRLQAYFDRLHTFDTAHLNGSTYFSTYFKGSTYFNLRLAPDQGWQRSLGGAELHFQFSLLKWHEYMISLRFSVKQTQVKFDKEPFDSILERICHDDVFPLAAFIDASDFLVRKTFYFLIKKLHFLQVTMSHIKKLLRCSLSCQLHHSLDQFF